MPAEELDVSHHTKAHRDDALPSWPGASLVEQVPKPLTATMQMIAHGIEAAVPPQTATPASKVIVTANQTLQQGPAEYQLGRGIGTTLGPLAAAPFIPGAGVTGFLPRLGVGAATGAGFGAASLVHSATSEGDFWRQKALQTGIGAGIGGATSALGGAVFGSRPPSPEVELLRANGIEPPPGAARGGLLAGVENAVGAVPVLGAPVQYGRRSAAGQLEQVLARNISARALLAQRPDLIQLAPDRCFDGRVYRVRTSELS